MSLEKGYGKIFYLASILLLPLPLPPPHPRTPHKRVHKGCELLTFLFRPEVKKNMKPPFNKEFLEFRRTTSDADAKPSTAVLRESPSIFQLIGDLENIAGILLAR
jgi:hypothetical protein